MPKKPMKKATKKPNPKPRKTAAKASAKAKRPLVLPPVPMLDPDAPNAQVLDRLWSTVVARQGADPEISHSARLLSRGMNKVAQKFGEEAVECLIEAVAGRRELLIGESADVLYHLLVMWVAAGVRPEEVWTELRRREGMSGIAEKASRPRRATEETSKIP